MKRSASTIVALGLAAQALFGPVDAAAQTAPPSAEAFGRLPAMSSPNLSPDGKHLAALVSTDGQRNMVYVWRTDAMDKAPRIFAADPRLQAVSVSFVKNDRLVVTTRQTYTADNIDRHLFKIRVVDLDGREIPLGRAGGFSDTDRYVDEVSSPAILNALPKDPQHILLINNQLTGAGDIVKVNLYTGRRETVMRGSDRFTGYTVDLQGEVRARQELDRDGKGAFLQQWIRHPDSGQWERHFRWYAKERDPKTVVGFTTDKNIAYVAASQGEDKISLWEYDIRSKKFLEKAFAHKLFDATSPVLSTADADYGEVLGFTYDGERPKELWVDPTLKSIAAGLQQALGLKTTPVSWTDIGTGEKATIRTGDGADFELIDWSNDRRLVLVEKSGPRQPPEYFLLVDGKELRPLGKARPSIDPASLGDTRMVQYPARDGLLIPAFLTTPPARFGKGPFPTIIVPHGGPWSRDSMSWDDSGWTQYFAARGYAVLQPQFRGSEGWSQKLWLAGDREWGQKMQDDKDDGVKWLIAQGIADKDRVAMHGYSYGGYSAFAAGVRPNGLYQCAIAGAGVAELGSFQRETREEKFQREFQGVTIEGLDPLSKASDVSIPMLIYHGDRDQTVPVKQSRMFAARLKSAGKPHKYVEYKDMGHQYVTWGHDDSGKVLTLVEDYLKADCGPGGL